jgi:hypothetical protein
VLGWGNHNRCQDRGDRGDSSGSRNSGSRNSGSGSGSGSSALPSRMQRPYRHDGVEVLRGHRRHQLAGVTRVRGCHLRQQRARSLGGEGGRPPPQCPNRTILGLLSDDQRRPPEALTLSNGSLADRRKL